MGTLLEEYMAVNDVDPDSLEHYGVKGMKWGVRKKDNTSGGNRAQRRADAKSQRRVEKTQKREAKALLYEGRAAKMDVAINDLNAEIAGLPPGIRSGMRRNQLTQAVSENAQYRDALLKSAKNTREGKLTDGQKLIIAGSIIAAAAGGYLLYDSMSQSGQLNSMALRGKAFLNGEKFEFKKNDNFSGKLSPEDVYNRVVKGLNPNYKDPGGQMNCRRCTFTYELRRRGYDVAATPSAMGWGQSETGLINALTPGGRNVYRPDSLSSFVAQQTAGLRGKGIRQTVAGDARKNLAQTFSVREGSDAKSVFQRLTQEPSGSRGEAVFNFGGFGHSLAYEIFDGKPYIFDTQKGQAFDEDTFNNFVNKWGAPRNVEFTRLDNLDLDINFLSRWATNTK
jgi:hypothetical protein